MPSSRRALESPCWWVLLLRLPHGLPRRCYEHRWHESRWRGLDRPPAAGWHLTPLLPSLLRLLLLLPRASDARGLVVWYRELAEGDKTTGALSSALNPHSSTTSRYVDTGAGFETKYAVGSRVWAREYVWRWRRAEVAK